MDNLLNFPPTNSDISPAYGFCFYYFYFMCYRIQLSSYWVFSFFFAFVFLFYLFYLLCFGRFFSSSPPFPPASSDSVLHGMEPVLFWLWCLVLTMFSITLFMFIILSFVSSGIFPLFIYPWAITDVSTFGICPERV